MTPTTIAGLALSLWLGASTFVTPIGSGNALTLPAQRHTVRVDPGSGAAPVWLLAIQKAGRDGDGLIFMRSDDEARSWRFYADIQPTYSHPDRADLVAVGRDVALVYAWEDAFLSGSTAHDVYFQWWRYQPASNGWAAQPKVLVFDSTSSGTAYLRAELAFDSRGRIWVLATRLESDGTFSLVTAVSSDGGASFQRSADLDRLRGRAGGRLLSLGSRMLVVYDAEDVGTAARIRSRSDSAALDYWEPAREVIPEGIYHGAALSAAVAPGGGFHLVYKTELDELRYRYFDGTSFGSATVVDTPGDWAVQPAITLRGDELVVFYTHANQRNVDYDMRVKILSGGRLGTAQIIDSVREFKGYPAAVESIPPEVTAVPCIYGTAVDASSSGWAKQVLFARPPPPPPADAGVPEPDAGPVDAGASDAALDGGLADGGTAADAGFDAGIPSDAGSDAGAVDAGPTDAGVADAGPGDAGSLDGGATDAGPADGGTGERLLFSDDFSRVSTGLGSGWAIDMGAWRTDGAAIANADGNDLAHIASPACADCRLETTVTTRGAESGIFLRALLPTAGTGYNLAVLADGSVEIRRWQDWVSTTLARAPGAVTSLSTPTRIALEARGAGPVELTALVNGKQVLAATDSSTLLAGAGVAGLWATRTGVVFDEVRLWELASTPPPPPDDAIGLPFSDNFNRLIFDGLGAGWTVVSGSWTVRRVASTRSAVDSAAYPTVPQCSQCQVQARVTASGNSAGVFLRARPGAPGFRYELVILPGGDLQIRRRDGSVVKVLATARGVVVDPSKTQRLLLRSTGTGPVDLTASLNGVQRLSVRDLDAGALTAAGKAGLWTNASGVSFDDFLLEAAK